MIYLTTIMNGPVNPSQVFDNKPHMLLCRIFFCNFLQKEKKAIQQLSCWVFSLNLSHFLLMNITPLLVTEDSPQIDLVRKQYIYMHASFFWRSPKHCLVPLTDRRNHGHSRLIILVKSRISFHFLKDMWSLWRSFVPPPYSAKIPSSDRTSAYCVLLREVKIKIHFFFSPKNFGLYFVLFIVFIGYLYVLVLSYFLIFTY